MMAVGTADEERAAGDMVYHLSQGNPGALF
jgi:hypothetical protein